MRCLGRTPVAAPGLTAPRASVLRRQPRAAQRAVAVQGSSSSQQEQRAPAHRRASGPDRPPAAGQGQAAHQAAPWRRQHSLPVMLPPFLAAAAANLATALPAQAAAGKIFDFNLTFVFMVGEFLLLMVFLEKSWFTPVGAVLDARDKHIREKLGSVSVRLGLPAWRAGRRRRCQICSCAWQLLRCWGRDGARTWRQQQRLQPGPAAQPALAPCSGSHAHHWGSCAWLAGAGPRRARCRAAHFPCDHRTTRRSQPWRSSARRP